MISKNLKNLPSSRSTYFEATFGKTFHPPAPDRLDVAKRCLPIRSQARGKAQMPPAIFAPEAAVRFWKVRITPDLAE
jgi:hypothetical protein